MDCESNWAYHSSVESDGVPRIQRLAHVLIRFSGTLLVTILGLALLFATIAGIQDKGNLSFQSMRVGLNATLMLMMQMDPPRTVLSGTSLLMVVFGWLICMLGWLVVPLLVGIIVDVGIGGQESESELRMRLYRYFRAAGVPEEQLDTAVQEAIDRMSAIGRKG